MQMMILRALWIALLTVLITSCGAATPDENNDVVGLNGTLTQVSEAVSEEDCPNGGVTLEHGIDLNADGTLSAWFTVPRTDGSTDKELRRIRTFPPMSGAVTMISPSRRNKGFLAATDRDQLGLFYSTSERVLWEAPSPLTGTSAIDMAPKANGAYVLRKDAIVALDIDNPHPEISLTALSGSG